MPQAVITDLNECQMQMTSGDQIKYNQNIENCDDVTICSPTQNLRDIATACSSLNVDFDKVKAPVPPAQKKAKVYVYTEQEIIDLPVKCDHCERRFKKPESLGGHVSKAHPGKSAIYAKKIARRNEREPDRLLLAKAKEILLQKDPTMNLIEKRALVTKTKNDLKKLQKKKQIVKQKFKSSNQNNTYCHTYLS